MSSIWRLSEEGKHDAAELLEVLSREIVVGRSKRVCKALEGLTARKEIGGISHILPFLFSKSQKEHTFAVAAITQLIKLVPTSAIAELYQKCYSPWNYWSGHHSPWFNLNAKTARKQLDNSKDASLACLLTIHPSGYIREVATLHLEKVETGEELRFILLRQNDWVESVAEAATRIVAIKLTDDYLENFVDQIECVTQLYCVKRRDHRKFLNRFLAKLVDENHSSFLSNALNNSEAAGHNKAHRRFIAALLQLSGQHRAQVCYAAAKSSDFVCRLLALESARKCLSIEQCRELAKSLAEDHFANIREASTELLASVNPGSRVAIWKQRLLDKNRSLRTTAQFYLRKADHDPAPHYRETLQQDTRSLPALCGLIECGHAGDLKLIRDFLSSPWPSRRSEAIRGISKLGTKPDIKGLLPFLLDKSPRVVRAAASSLSLANQSLDPDSLLRLGLQATSSQSKKSIVELLGNMDRWHTISEMLQLSVHDDELASLAEHAVENWFSHGNSYLQPSTSQRNRIQLEFKRYANRLSSEFSHSLTMWLRPYGFKF